MSYAYSLLAIYQEIKDLIWSEEDVVIDSMATRLSYKTLTSSLDWKTCPPTIIDCELCKYQNEYLLDHWCRKICKSFGVNMSVFADL